MAVAIVMAPFSSHSKRPKFTCSVGVVVNGYHKIIGSNPPSSCGIFVSFNVWALYIVI